MHQVECLRCIACHKCMNMACFGTVRLCSMQMWKELRARVLRMRTVHMTSLQRPAGAARQVGPACRARARRGDLTRWSPFRGTGTYGWSPFRARGAGVARPTARSCTGWSPCPGGAWAGTSRGRTRASCGPWPAGGRRGVASHGTGSVARMNGLATLTLASCCIHTHDIDKNIC